MLKLQKTKEFLKLVLTLIAPVCFITVLLGLIVVSFTLYRQMMEHMFQINLVSLVGIWLLIGLICGFWWPITFRTQLSTEDWRQVKKVVPLLSVTGPWAILLTYPI